MPYPDIRQIGVRVAILGMAWGLTLTPWLAHSQASAAASASGTVHGYVRDSSGKPVSGARVAARPAGESANPQELATQTDADGAYRISLLPPGTYSLYGEATWLGGATSASVTVADKEIKAVDLTFGTSKAAIATPAFFDEPQFTVAGVTQAANSGGHGSDTVLRTTEALARATAVLSQQSGTGGAQDPSDAEGSLRQAVIRDPTNFEANLRLGESLFNHDQYAEAAQFLSQASRLDPQASAPHRLIGDVEEKLGHPLEAERAYESAATLDPSEENLLDWGSELLVHRALEPATQVFSKGNHLFPKSVRMLVALGVAWYARGAYREAARCLENASDMAPRDPTPYLFLGKMQTVAAIPEPGSVERLARFVKLYPDKALANYYYAVGLWKQLKGGSQNGRIAAENFKLVDSLLRTAVRLDPQLGAAHLQLGIVYAERSDYQLAIPEFQKAVEVSAALDDTAQQAHYRLAQAYRRTGDHEHVKVELELQARSASQAREYAEQKRREIGEFVVALRTQPASAPTQP